MRILSVEIKNIASIEDAFIDFEHGALAHDSLFLICGETGSGKTTILDAICLALYADAPRTDNSSNEKTSNITIYDTLNFLRNGETKGWAKVRFLGNDRNTYSAQYEIHHTHNNVKCKKTASWILTDEKNNFSYKKKTEITNKIEEIIGLKYEQFIQTTILAQGRFAEFLKTDEKGKAAILEKLTGNNIYSLISKKIHEKYNKLRNELDNKKSSINNIVLLTPEEIDFLNSENKRITDFLAKTEMQIISISNRINWLSRKEDIQNSIDKRLNEMREIERTINSNEFQLDMRLTNLYRETEEIRNVISSKANYEKELLENDKCLSLSIKLFGSLLANSVELNSSREKIYREKEVLLSQKNSLERHSQMADISQTIVSKLDNAKKLSSSALENNKILNEQVSLLQKASSDANEYQKKFNIHKQTIAEIDKIISSLKEEMVLLPRTELSKRQNELRKRRDILNDIKRLYDDIKSQKELLDTETKDIEVHKAKLITLNNSLNVLQQEKEKKTISVNTSKEKLQRHETTVDEFVARLRASLSEGEPCPVCGSTSHNIKTEAFLIEQLQKSKAEFEIEENALNLIKDDINKTSVEINNINMLIIKGTEKINSYNKKEKELTLKLNALFDKLNEKPNEEHIISLCEETNSQLSEVDNKINKSNILQEKLDELNNKRTETSKEEHEIAETITSNENTITQAKTNITNLEKLIKNSLEEETSILNSLDSLISIDNWQDLYNSNCNGLIDEIKQITKQWTEINQGLDKTNTRLSNADEFCSKSQELISEIQAISPALAKIKASDFMTDGNLNDTNIQLASVKTKLSDSYKRIADLKCNIQHLSDAVSSFISNNSLGIDMPTLSTLYSLTPDNVKAKEETIKKVTDEYSLSHHYYKAALESFEQHLQTSDSSFSTEGKEELNKQKNSLINIKNNASENLSDVKVKLKLEENNKELFNKEANEIEAMEKEISHWDSLNNEFGSSEGDKFRKIAQSYTFSYLLSKANEHMRYINPRYTLECESNSHSILIRDNYMAGEIRAFTTLSGGETFLVSLALALGLSSLSDRKLQVETLFIDEGFGSLSPNCLEDVISTLERLQQQGRKIGIISHVAELSERIKTKIQLSRKNGKSTIEIIG